MADRPKAERLQPSLLDRLTDNSPDHETESRAQRVLSMRKLRDAVIRDLLALLNTTKLEVVQRLDQCPEVETSVLNFGVPDFAGIAPSSIDKAGLERQLRDAICAFEPRLKKGSVRVRALAGEVAYNSLALEIEGDLWAEPMPVRLYLKTELDLEDGSILPKDKTVRR